jgi:hypothetical protein
MRIQFVVGILWCIVAWQCSTVKRTATQSTFIHFNDARIQYQGRVGMMNEAAELYWSGTTVRIRFEGTGAKVLLKDYNGQNYYNVIIDSDSLVKIHPDSTQRYYTLAENLPAGKHTIELFKRTQIHKEYKRGYTRLYGFQLNEGGKLLPPPARAKRKMEFYGNSVTCGHAIEDTTGGDSGASQYENNYLAYGAVTARHFNAQYHCISKSGIGLMVSFGAAIMPELYDKLNPFDSTSRWDFSQYQPDIVVVNLLQNDAGIVNRAEYEHFKKRFGTQPPADSFVIQSYQAFIKKLRGQYPHAHIICALGSMNTTQEGSKWPGLVRAAVDGLHDKKVYTHFFAYKGTPLHPRVKDNAVMAKSLIAFIEQNIKW